jgi:hypothetical protein
MATESKTFIIAVDNYKVRSRVPAAALRSSKVFCAQSSRGAYLYYVQIHRKGKTCMFTNASNCHFQECLKAIDFVKQHCPTGVLRRVAIVLCSHPFHHCCSSCCRSINETV